MPNTTDWSAQDQSFSRDQLAGSSATHEALDSWSIDRGEADPNVASSSGQPLRERLETVPRAKPAPPSGQPLWEGRRGRSGIGGSGIFLDFGRGSGPQGSGVIGGPLERPSSGLARRVSGCSSDRFQFAQGGSSS